MSAPDDPHLIALAAYAETLRSLGMPRWQAAQRAYRAIPRTTPPRHAAPTPPVRQSTVPVAYRVAPRGPDTGTLALYPITPEWRLER